MPFIGNQPALSYTSFAKQDFTTSATTSYTLDNSVTNENEIALFINFVRQEPTTAYTASGTTLTLSSATSASDDMYCVFLGKALQTVNPPAGSVGTSQLASGAVTAAKIDSGVALGKVLQVLTATDTTERTTTSSTFVTGSNTMLINITPSSTSSKIFLISTFSGRVQGGGAMYTIYRDSTNIGATNGITRVYNAGDLYFNISMSILDAPSSTSQIAYQVYFNCQNGGTATLNSGNLKASLTAFEVGA